MGGVRAEAGPAFDPAEPAELGGRARPDAAADGRAWSCCCRGSRTSSSRARSNLSVETIKDHVAAVLRTLNVSSRTQAVLVGQSAGRQGLAVGALDTESRNNRPLAAGRRLEGACGASGAICCR